MDYLKEDENIEKLIISFIEDFKVKAKEEDIYKEVLDPFSSMIEAGINNLDYDDWLEAEKSRQKQKTLQNAIGDLHQKLLANIKDVNDLGVGNLIDIVCHEKNIVAEIKNKYNTTKGNHKVAIYDDLEAALKKPEYKDYTAYYVEMIPKNPTPLDSPFTPSDNTKTTNKTRPSREDIRQIDGKSFYELLTGKPDALNQMYDKISKILVDKYKLGKSEQFNDLFNRAYEEGYVIGLEIEKIQQSRNIQLIEKGDVNRKRSLQWKHGECEFKAQMWRLAKEGGYKCPTCKNILEMTIDE